METKPLISVVVPIYNCEKYIKDCIDSLVNQTYSNLEILLIDDGSSDKSVDLIRSYYSDDKRVVLIRKENGGVSSARNVGIERSTGQFLTFVDGDDYISKNFIEEAYALIDEYDLDFVLGGTRRFSETGHRDFAANTGGKILIYEDDLNVLKKRILSNGIAIDDRLENCFTSGPVCKLFRTSVIQGLKFDTALEIGEDTVFNLQVLDLAKKVGVVDHIWYHYRENLASATRTYTPDIREKCEKNVLALSEMYKNNSDMTPFLTARIVQQFHEILTLYPLHPMSQMNYVDRRQYINDVLGSDPWRDAFDIGNLWNSPVKKFDKIMSIFCAFHATDLLIIYESLRVKLKSI